MMDDTALMVMPSNAAALPVSALVRSRIPWCACRTSPCTLKDTWQSWDINPLMVLPSGQGVKAVDALVVLRGALAQPDADT